jgi:hypothetical protein
VEDGTPSGFERRMNLDDLMEHAVNPLSNAAPSDYTVSMNDMKRISC